MQSSTGRIVDVDSLAQLDRLLARGARSMDGWRLQDLDLRDRDDALAGVDPQGAVLLGCDLSPELEARLVAGGALVFRDVPETPFNAYRSTLYSPDELLDVPPEHHERSLDARVYAWSRQRSRDVAHTLASAMHDHAIDDALTEWVRGRRIVGVMGGHRVQRDDPAYLDAARLGRALAIAGRTVATGGGPGAMEAANLGGRAAGVDEGVLAAAVRIVATVPTYAGAMAGWLRTGLEARALLTSPSDTLGVPTWHYGHEPPNLFQTAAAKYFQNSVREDLLLRVATAGIVVLPGEGGTVQEIFQDACEVSYADEASWTPIVLVGRAYWTERYPAWQLLEAVMRGRPGAQGIVLVDSVDEAVERLLALER
ncbi:LOG family protein [Agrococcus versicolor]|uniref:LOG family protein n=1 Tax=Agrococcus versicolor TaxID=501482 RepID=A0ABN3AM14_9MICO